VRFLLAVTGGGLALAYEIDEPMLAAEIGAATPLIIKAFSEGIRPVVSEIPPEQLDVPEQSSLGKTATAK
jgi:hypothetical protein